MIVIATGFIPLSPLSIVSTIIMLESSQWFEYCAKYWLKELQENMDRCNGRCDITELLLKTALKSIQSFNQSTTPLRAISPFPTAFSKDLLQTRKNQGLFGKGFKADGKCRG